MFKKDSFENYSLIPRRKWVYFIILTVVLFFCSIQAARYSDLPKWSTMPDYFIKPQNADMLLYNLSISYIVSYMFYILVNFMPDIFDAIEKKKTTLLFRASIQREVQQFVKDILSLWTDIGINACNRGSINRSDLNEIGNLFDFEVIEKISEYVKLMELVDENIEIDVGNDHYVWYIKLTRELDKICNMGNLILTRYKENIQSEIFYDIFYILNESGMIGQLLAQLNSITYLKNGKNYRLMDCISFIDNNSIKGKSDINQTCLSVIKLYNWVNNQYDYLSKNINNDLIKIYKIDFNKFFMEKELI